MRLFRKVDGAWEEFTRDSYTPHIVKRLAKFWKSEFVDPVRKSSKKRTREDASSQPAPLPSSWRKEMQDMVNLTLAQRDAALKSAFSKDISEVKELLVAGFSAGQARLQTEQAI